MNNQYIEGHYYKGFGKYLGTRIQHLAPPSKKETMNHIFSTGVYDTNGAVILKTIKV